MKAKIMAEEFFLAIFKLYIFSLVAINLFQNVSFYCQQMYCLANQANPAISEGLVITIVNFKFDCRGDGMPPVSIFYLLLTPLFVTPACIPR